MNQFFRWLQGRTKWQAALLSLGIVLLTYPKFFTLGAFPMYQGGWLLHDTAPAHWNFIPTFRVFRYELFEQGNILWSNLRAFGLPILADGIQIAPLFPLTLLLSPLPEEVYWHYSILVRLMLTSAGLWLVAREILKLRPAPAFVLVMAYAFSIHVLKWMNHPWHIGVLAGVWYLYFLGKISQLEAGPAKSKKSSRYALGLALAVYSVVTCGFPEAAAMDGVLACLIFLPYFFRHAYKRRPMRQWIFPLCAGHLIGLLASSPQILAVLDAVQNSPPHYRHLPGLYQYPSAAFLFDTLVPLGMKHAVTPVNSYFGLIPMALFFFGVITTLIQRNFRIFDVSALLCLFFYFFKTFPLWPAFNELVAALPLFKQTWFTSYFFTLALWPFAWFAARGLEGVWVKQPERTRRTLRYVMGLVVVGVLVWTYFLAKASAPVQWSRVTPLLILFAAFCGLFLLYLGKAASRKIRAGLCALLLAEFLLIRPAFVQPSHYHAIQHSLGPELRLLLEDQKISRLDYREASPNGNYIGSGIATADGCFALQPHRLQLFRDALFRSQIDSPPYALYPIADQTTPYSWNLASIALHIEAPSPFSAQTAPQGEGLRELRALGGASGTGRILFDENALSRAYVPSSCHEARDVESAVKVLKDASRFKLGTLIVEDLEQEDATLCRWQQGKTSAVPIESDTGTKVVLSKVSGPRFVVLNDNFYTGWKVRDRLSGKELPIRPANVAFRAVPLFEARPYQLEFSYEPQWWAWSKICMLLALVLAGAVIAFGVIAKPKGPKNRNVQSNTAAK